MLLASTRFRVAVLAAGAALLVAAGSAFAITSVTLPGEFQSELGCSGDWMPDCASTHLTLDGGTGKWNGTFTIPTGNYQYKVAIADSWTENYGAGGVPGGNNISLNLADTSPVTFQYDPQTHIVTQSTGIVVVAAGSFQSEVGCSGDWMPDCLNSQLLPGQGGIYSFQTSALPGGDYEFKIAIGQSWNENYGQDGVPGGNNLPFTVPANGGIVTFTYDSATHVPGVTVEGGTPTRKGTWGSVKSLYR